MYSRSLALKPVGPDPAGQVLNSHGNVRLVGVAVEEPVPDSLSAGADRIIYATSIFSISLFLREINQTGHPSARNVSYSLRSWAVAQPSSFDRSIFCWNIKPAFAERANKKATDTALRILIQR